MTCDFDSSTARPPAATRMRTILRNVLLRLLWIVPGVAIVCLAIFLSVGRTKLSESLGELMVTLVYSGLIGPSAAALLVLISHRVPEKRLFLLLLLDAIALLGAATIGVLAGSLLLQRIGIFAYGHFWSSFWEAWPFSIVITLMVGLSVTTFETMRFKLQAATLELRTRQMEQERAYKLLAEAQLASLESRIHPHFLFNTLNSIAALIPSNPLKAEDTVGKLASLLRFSLTCSQCGTVPLREELKIVRDYLEIEKTRFGPRLRYEIAVPEGLNQAQVPPLALQSLVENAVKHVVSRRTEGATILVKGEMLTAGADASTSGEGGFRLEVIDDGPGFSLEALTAEHGLGNLQARLELLFGPECRLEVARQDGKTSVRLSFPACILTPRS